MNARMQRLCSWGGLAMIVIMLVGLLVFANFVPPPSPALSAQAVADLYRDHTNSIRLGMLLVSIGAAFLALFVAEITVQMKRIEGRHSPLSYVQLALGALFVIEFIIPVFVALAASYRPERSPELTQALNDLCWLMFVGVVSTAVLQCIVIAVAMLMDRRENPIFPRWVGYFNIWAAVLFSPGGVVVFFKGGPLAWNGLFTFWIPLSVFGIWFGVMTWALLAAIRRQEQEFDASSGADEVDGSDDLDVRRQLELLSAEFAAFRAERSESRTV